MSYVIFRLAFFRFSVFPDYRIIGLSDYRIIGLRNFNVISLALLGQIIYNNKYRIWTG